MTSIGALSPSLSSGFASQATAAKPASADAFRSFLMGSIQEVNGMQQDAEKAMNTLMTGGDVLPAEVLTSVQKADLSLKLLMQVRNKLVAAYQELKDVRI
jgi:flagellar hook-basal body complex protein FliE